MTAELPVDLEQAIDAILAPYETGDLRRATEALSERYRTRRTGGAAYVAGELDAAAYVAYRMPATFAAIQAAFRQLVRRVPAWQPASLLDLGAGTGAGLYAATGVWPDIERSTLVDRDPSMLHMGELLYRALQRSPAGAVEWLHGDLLRFNSSTQSDLVLASYVLNELGAANQAALVRLLWSLTADVLVLVEPGTPAGFRTIRAARQALIENGAHLLAPCPHGEACPMPSDDWCHFSVRLARSRIHRQVKPGERGYEDEKFSYVIASRLDADAAGARVLRHPIYRRGMVQLTLCTDQGLEGQTITRRKDRDRYRHARAANWGDEIPPRSS